MDASPSTSDTSYMSIDLDSSILHQVQKAIHRYDLSTCTDCLMFDLPLVHACVHIYRSLEPRVPESEPGFEVNICGTNQHSCIIHVLLSIDLQQLPNRSLRMMKKYPYPKASNQLPSLSPYQVTMQIFSQSMIHI